MSVSSWLENPSQVISLLSLPTSQTRKWNLVVILSAYWCSPLGQTLRPLIDNLFNPSRGSGGFPLAPPTLVGNNGNIMNSNAPLPQFLAAEGHGRASSNNSVASSNSDHSGANGSPSKIPVELAPVDQLNPVKADITTPAELKSFLASQPAVILFFTSPTCRPCHAIAPDFDRIVKTHGVIPRGFWNAGRQGLAVAKIDVGASIALTYSVMAAPTFIMIYGDKKIKEVRGANVKELDRGVRHLMNAAYPVHQHLSQAIQTPLEMSPILFKQTQQVPGIFKKINELLLQASNPSLLEVSKALEHSLVGNSTSVDLPSKWESLIGEWIEDDSGSSCLQSIYSRTWRRPSFSLLWTFFDCWPYDHPCSVTTPMTKVSFGSLVGSFLISSSHSIPIHVLA